MKRKTLCIFARDVRENASFISLEKNKNFQETRIVRKLIDEMYVKILISILLNKNNIDIKRFKKFGLSFAINNQNEPFWRPEERNRTTNSKIQKYTIDW